MQPRKASSVVLLRQGKGKQLEVLMAQRSKNLKSFAGAFVFPGGVAESCDGEEGTREQSKRCGLRELFEEAGVLLAKSRVGNRAKPVSFASKEERREWQKRVKDNPKEFDQLLKEKNATLATDALFYWVTFITPIFETPSFERELHHFKKSSRSNTSPDLISQANSEESILKRLRSLNLIFRATELLIFALQKLLSELVSVRVEVNASK